MHRTACWGLLTVVALLNACSSSPTAIVSPDSMQAPETDVVAVLEDAEVNDTPDDVQQDTAADLDVDDASQATETTAGDATSPADDVTAPGDASETAADVVETDSSTPADAIAKCFCGDKICLAACGETVETCVLDCAPCGDGICSPGEGPINCSIDCCSGGCGDGICRGYQCGESPATCPWDCGKACGNKVCEKGESPATCPTDCVFQVCGNNVCEPGDGGPQACPIDCGNSCGNCVCDKGETFVDCPVDCGFCGDQICSNCKALGENSTTCPFDCKSDGCKDGCDDGVACTIDICNSQSQCMHVPDATKCDDGSVCTLDLCAGGGCQHNPGLVPFCEDDKNLCTDDVCQTGACVHLPNAVTCDDGEPCTVGDACKSGKCHSGAANTCNDSNPCTNDACDGGTCFNVPNTAFCDDGNACTVADVCSGGACSGSNESCDDGTACTLDICTGASCLHPPSTVVTCEDDQNTCTNDVCQTGACVHLANAATCDDGDGCTVDDACQKGICYGGGPKSCDDQNACTNDACAGGGCLHLPNTVPCNDGNDCTVADVCSGGVCTGSPESCDDGTVCTLDLCNGIGCTHQPSSASACEDDTNLCTNDVCQSGACAHLANAVTCNDGDACTLGDVCQNSMCHPGQANGCDDGNACTNDACVGGACVHLPNKVVCFDGNDCTVADVCTGGTCTGSAISCDDGTVCTLDLCNGTGCSHVPSLATACEGDQNHCTDDVCQSGACVHLANAATCNDGDGCTLNDTCAKGSCVPGAANTCDDQNPCTNDACSGGACLPLKNTALCDDGDACTIADICSGGSCAGSAKPCDDANLCTLDACASGICQHTPSTVTACSDDFNLCTDDVCQSGACVHLPNSVTCSDGDGCTVGDTCTGGTCLGTVKTCDDQNACTNDACVAGACVSVDNASVCSDGNPCTVADVCYGGTCNGTPKSCDDGNSCTADSCDNGFCLHVNTTAPCDDNNVCTSNDHCQDGACVSLVNACACQTASDCTDNNACTIDGCDAVTKQCVNKLIQCDDMNPCTADTCDAITGQCVFTNDNNLKPLLSACTPDDCNFGIPICVNGATSCGIAAPNPAKDGQSCGGGGTCANGVCVGNQVPTVTSADFNGIGTPGAPFILTVVVSDANSDVANGVNDIAQVVVFPNEDGSGTAIPMTYTGPGATTTQAIYTASVPTAGLVEGVYLLPLAITDKAGAVTPSIAPLYIYTGNALHVGPGQSYVNIKAAILDANDGDAVIVHPGTYTGSGNKNISFGGKKIVLIGQGGAAQTILDCQSNGRALVLLNSGETSQTVIAGFTIENCAGSAIRMVASTPGSIVQPRFVDDILLSNTNADRGGAVYASGVGTLADFARCTFNGNWTSGNNYQGGGMSMMSGASAKVQYGTYWGNTANTGGAISLDGGGALTILGCHFDSNGISNGYGGAAVCVSQDGAGKWGTLSITGGWFTGHNGMWTVRADAGATVTGVRFYSNQFGIYGNCLTFKSCTFEGHIAAVEQRGSCGGFGGIYTDCKFTNNSGKDQGAAVRGDYGSYKNCTFTNNHSVYDGGAIRSDSGGSVVDTCTFNGNSAGRWGGALYIDSNGVIKNSTFYNNSAPSGGAFLTFNGATITDTTFTLNHTVGDAGGAIWQRWGSLSRVVLDGNRADTNGGGAHLENVWIDTLEARGNTAHDGGGMYYYTDSGGTRMLTNILLAGNKVANAGGGLYLDVYGPEVDFRNLTVADNTADKLAGGVYYNGSNGTTDYSIIWGNSSPMGAQVAVTSAQLQKWLWFKFSLIGTADGDIVDNAGQINSSQGFYQGDGNGNLELDPLFVPGPLGNYYLSQTGSGQAQQSVAVNPVGTGVTWAEEFAMDNKTTSTTGGGDVGSLDLGYHYLRSCPVGSVSTGGTCAPLVTGISVDLGALSPAFSPSVGAYAVNANAKVTSATATITVTAAPGTQFLAGVNDITPTPVGPTFQVPLLLGVNRLRILASQGGAGGMMYTLNINRTGKETYLKASNPDNGDVFGYAVAIDGDTIVVGAHGEDSSSSGIDSVPDNAAPDAGAVYVFVRTAGVWTQQAYLKAPNPDASDYFGYSVAISGDTLVVAAVGEDSGQLGPSAVAATDNAATDSGAAYVYTRSAGVWTLQAYLKASNTGVSDSFGASVAINGDSIVVGADGEDSSANGSQADNGYTNAGAAYVFARTAGTWTQQAYLKAAYPQPYDEFGHAVRISGNTVAISAWKDDGPDAGGINGNQQDNTRGDTGAVYAFSRSGTTWSQQAYIQSSPPHVSNLFGGSISLEGDTLIVGDTSQDTTVPCPWCGQNTPTGGAWVFHRTGINWSQQTVLKAAIADVSDWLGQSVAFAGNLLIAGAHGEDSSATGYAGDQTDNSTSNAGAARIFVLNSGRWIELAYLKALKASPNDDFGFSSAVSGQTFVVCAPWEDGTASGVGGDFTATTGGDVGACYVFE